MVVDALIQVGDYLPQFLGGLVVLLLGLFIATGLREVVLKLLGFLRVEEWFTQLGRWLTVGKRIGARKVWSEILAELVRWSIVILFLVPAVEAWGLPRVTDVLNQVLLFLPNVFVAVVVGFIGFAIANLIHDIVSNAALGLGSNSAQALASIARYSVVFFTVLVVLNQLGVASDLVRILFTGIVVMLALAGGIAFGLGGQDWARGTLKDLASRFEERSEKVNSKK
ncbi:hypothetical protein A3H85_03075 [Candidatus Daviesbacteria bacterium RIFCSPLOWO2_02_FULL_40_8]|uniref:Small-conductance mechanosensitive ion channel n=1 Tax=Candidatus Daviesbacteria bacterium RIFCSPLOWO2_01_FULL_40_24 TaxID=1797787 RepID=A0A1F5MJ50_9BACT|nr:MAG: hypothetical protein A2780_00370 [Candidatus Daviesbacteria bacterium RIFCSPHIGHO2_01_FULL_41_45]OGE34473.1 MAG: hypothetical protein A3C32_03970 [Candidatus Daviesbacteria bacterium RIFCSPHIGHO2_02_FULL_41_14]OGE65385.1 MAG: hypothetical protein A3B49_00665 [Candidatus Daviesbacteria bacterium RIFCSPLOWO2_01_FULL_40_24]OGE66755.1 MAG: hypothetical protein A3H85_03075 [Candidatus Daviesbacteria bacterium RIFCSPLOWO2_02_FULL_40_8]